MINMEIIDDNGIKKVYYLKKYNTFVEGKELHIEMLTLTEKIKYVITEDIREDDIDQIKLFVLQELQDALNKKRVLHISEYLQRSYLYIGDDNTRRQFTAIRVI